MTDLYDVARQVTDEVLGEGAYAEINGGNPDPAVQRAIKRGPARSITCPICGMTSYHPEDIKEGYCGNCHEFTSK